MPSYQFSYNTLDVGGGLLYIGVLQMVEDTKGMESEDHVYRMECNCTMFDI